MAASVGQTEKCRFRGRCKQRVRGVNNRPIGGDSAWDPTKFMAQTCSELIFQEWDNGQCSSMERAGEKTRASYLLAQVIC
jgi:hypothetical protein